eukprot:1966159-Pyramimonas_sp.AAC.1
MNPPPAAPVGVYSPPAIMNLPPAEMNPPPVVTNPPPAVMNPPPAVMNSPPGAELARGGGEFVTPVYSPNIRGEGSLGCWVHPCRYRHSRTRKTKSYWPRFRPPKP